jgi:ABC-type amino acid transport/signal transduction systems, periplasmic component/domain
MKARWLLSLLLLLTPLWPAMPATSPLTVVTEDLPPLNYQDNGKVSGIATEIVAATLRKAGIDATPRIYPWARAISMAELQENVLIYSIARIPEREKRFQWIGPLFPFSESIYKLKQRQDIQLATLEQAKQYQLGVIRGYAVHEMLKREGFVDNVNLQLAKDQEQNLRKLFSGKTDLLVGSALDLRWRLQHHPEIGHFEDLARALYLEQSFTHVYMAFGLKTRPELVARLRHAFEQIQADGTLDQILGKYHYQETTPTDHVAP